MLTLFPLNKEQSWRQFLVRWLVFGMLLSASWYVHPLFSLFCFVPYFVTLFRSKANGAYYLQLFILNLTWNAAVTYWLCQLDLIKGPGTLLINSVLFLIPAWIWRLYIRYTRIRQGQAFALLAWWLLFEYAHHLWDFSWTWLTVGNVFGKAPHLVLWYSCVGVMGGSAWILVCNYLIWQLVKQPLQIRKAYLPLIVILLPMGLSMGMLFLQKTDPDAPVKDITAIATTMGNKEEISDMQKVKIIDSLAMLDPRPKAVTLLPEILLSNNVWLNRFPNGDIYARLRRGLYAWKTGHIIIGALLNVPDPDGVHEEERMSMKARYNCYNAALMINTSDTINIKLKKVFVPVAEYVPSYLSFLNLQTYGFKKEPSNSDIFEIDGNHYFIGICYEVVNSVFMAGHLQQNTNAILMLSSESFFGDSETGREQYMNICRLRSLENNLPLVKSSNDGIVLAVNAGGGLLEAKRTVHPYVMHTAVRLSTPSSYHAVVAYIPYLLFMLLGGLSIQRLRLFPLTGISKLRRFENVG
jgi:apolipoprotein N-acyltransferase